MERVAKKKAKEEEQAKYGKKAKEEKKTQTQQ